MLSYIPCYVRGLTGFFWHNAPVSHGNSGGPAFLGNDLKNVVAVLSSGWVDGKPVANTASWGYGLASVVKEARK